MCYVIVTARSLLWLLVSLIAFLMVLSGVLTPKWLIGPEKTKSTFNSTEVFTPTVGIYNRCTQIGHRTQCGPFAFDGFATEDVVYPACWKAALFFLALGLALLCCTLAFGVLGCCLQAVCKKSIFSLAGAAQSLAGVCCVFGLVLYPWGWGAQRVQRLCGSDAQPYFPADCTLGWAFYCCIGGVVLTFVASLLSACADRAANSDKVQFEMDEGKHLICLA